LLLPIFEFFKTIKFPIWLINQIFIFSSFSLGIFGIAKLSKLVSKYFYKKESKEVYIYGGILSIASLCTYWIFNQPNLFFISAFASVPWIIIFVLEFLDNTKSKSPTICKILKYLFLFYIIILFFQTTINLVVFLILILSIFLIVLTIRSFDKGFQKKEILKLIMYLLIPVVAYLLSIQIILFVTGNRQFVLSYIYDYYNNIISNPLTASITADLRASGYLRNTFANNLLFSNSWMETHVGNTVLFQNYTLYSNGIFRLIGLLPFFISLYAVFLFSPKKSKHLAQFHFLLFLSILFMSTLALRLTETIHLLEEIFRWSSSKFWVLYLIPFTILGAISIKKVFKKKYIKIIFIILMLIYVFPIFKGELFSEELVVNIPEEYFSLDGIIDSSKTYYYLPEPNSLYFYQYDWGYFGSDLVGYMTKGNYYDSGVVSYFNNYEKYQEVIELLKDCEEYVDGNIIFDQNLESSSAEIEQCLKNKYSVINQIDNLTIYSH
jgi:hypothetical protein